MARKSERQRLKIALKSSKPSRANSALINEYIKGRSKELAVGTLLGEVYTLNKLAASYKKHFGKITADEAASFVKNAVSKGSSKRAYRQTVRHFYSWLKEAKKAKIDEDIISPELKIEFGKEESREEAFERRIKDILSSGELSEKQRKTLSKYFNEKKINGVSARGIANKLYFLKRLGIFLKKPYEEVTKDDLADFLSKNGAKEEDSNNTYKAYLKDFFKWLECYEDGYPPIVKWLCIKKSKANGKLAEEILTDKEIRRMLQFAGNQRDKTIIFLLRDSGARIGELTNLNIEDVELRERSAFLKLSGKTGERKAIIINSVAELRLWLNNHPFKDIPKAPLFFATSANRYGQRLQRNGISRMLANVAERAGIKRHIHPHLFRHTCLTKTASVLSESELKVFAGWARSSKMAEVYVHLTEDDVTKKILIANDIIEADELPKPENELKEIVCMNSTCSYVNPAGSAFCNKCGIPLTLKTAITLEKKRGQEQELHKELFRRPVPANIKTADMREALYQILKSDEGLKQKLRQIAKG